MKRKTKKIMALILVVVLVLANASMVFASWGDPGYKVYTDGRWYQWFSFNNACNYEKYSYQQYYSQYNRYQEMKKLYSNRDAVFQVTQTGSKYPTYFSVKICYSDCADTITVSITGNNSMNAPYYTPVSLSNTKCMAYSKNSKQTVSYIFKGVWSPDIYK